MKKINNQSGFVSILLVLIILAGIGGGVYFYSKQKSGVNVEGTKLTAEAQGTTTKDIDVMVSKSKKNETGVTIEKPVMIKTADMKVFACDNSRYSSSENKANINGNIAGLKALNYELMAYLNDHKSYPTSLADFENYGTKQDFSKTGYAYAYYPKVNPTHYHLGMKIENGAACGNGVAFSLKNKANFNSKSAQYVNGFDGTASDILDFHDAQNN